MHASKPVDAPSMAAAGASLGDLLLAAGVDRTSTILVTGPGGLAALLWLCRHGYEQVGLLRAGAGPHEDCDLLWAPLTCDIPTLAAMLQRGPHPQPGGVLMVQTPGSARDTLRPGLPDPTHALLRRHGYRVERCLHGHHRDLHVARRAVCGRGSLAA